MSVTATAWSPDTEDTDDLLPEFFPTPKNDAGKRKGEARASSRESVGQERTQT